jgi:phage-related protein
VAIQVGSVEVDVIPNTRGIYNRLRAGLVPAATRAGEDAGRAAGRAFGPAMSGAVDDTVATRIGQQLGQQIALRITASIRDAMRNGITQGGRMARPAAVREGDNTGGAFSRALKTRLEAAFRSLPKINIDANTSEADADLQALRVRMESLANKRIGIDIDAGAARAEIRLIEAELTRLGAKHPNVQVRADTASALAELAAVHGVDTSGAVGAILHLAVAIGGLTLIPAIPILAAGIGAIGAAAVAASVGVGALVAVAVPAFISIGGALQAQKAAQEAATNSTMRGAQAASQGASRALQMAGAQQALAAAERNGARQIAQAQQQVRQAKTSAADAIVQAAERNAQAAQAIEDAERSLARSQRDARRAQQDLTDARREAALELEDLNARLAGAQLSERDAVLGVREAQTELNRARSEGATGIDLERAQLAYDQAVQRLKDQTTETKRLKSETSKANKAGVDGSDTVRSAQERLAQAQEQVEDRTRAVRDAQTEAARTQVQTARQVAQAQERVSEATANVAQAQQSAAEAVANAQRQIASASLSAAGGVDQAAIAQAKYKAALAKMTPAARQTFDAFNSLRTAFGAWSRSLQPAVMPIFTRALNGIKNSLPGLTPFVLAAAKAIGNLQDRVSAGFKSPWWKQFKKDLAGSVGPAIEGLGIAFGRTFKGMAGIVQAFLPHMTTISGIMQRITGRFANWATNLKGSPGFESFLAYAAEMAPVVASSLRDIGGAVLRVAKALAPAATIAYLALGAVARVIGSIAEHLPWLIQLIYAVWIATKLWTLAVIVFNLAWNANPITLIIIAIVALVAAVIYAYKNFEWFRKIVDAAWSGIKTAALWVWNNVLKPVFNGIWTALKAVGEAASWLWNTVLSPVFSFIGTAAKYLAVIVLTILIVPLVLAFKLLAAVAGWLWENALKPAWDAIKKAFDVVGAAAKWLWNTILSPVFGWIGDKAKWLWDKAIKPAWDSIKKAMQIVGDAISILWNDYGKPILTWLGDKGKWLWDKALKPAFDNIKRGIEAIGKSFEDAKDFIGKAWNKIQDLAKKPVRFIIETIYNKGIVPTWNKIASAFGANPLKKIELPQGFARGGILPGYTPGKDVHKFVSPTGGGLELSGGEAIMRPEFTRAVGAGFVSTMNRIATTRGATGVKAALAPALGGNDTTQRFADGGIFGWIGKTASGIGSAAWDKVKEGASWLTDGLEKSARAGMKYVIDPLLAKFPGAETNFGKMIRKVPTRILDSIFGYSKEADKKGAGGIGGPRIQAALKWAKTQNGLPYQWGGNGNPSWDCSGFLSAIESVIRGQKPHRRWATGAFSGKTAPSGWVLNGKSPFQIGITNAGVGHTAGTLGRVNVESRGGDGVVVGSRARGANAMMFPDIYGFMPGKFDSGGYLQPGLNLAYNGTGRPEPVFTSQQASALTRMAAAPAGAGTFEGELFLDSGELLGVVHGVMNQRDQRLVSTLRAGRRG